MSTETPFGQRLVAWWARFAAAAALLSLAELLLIGLDLATSLSSVGAALQTWALLSATFFAPSLLLALACALVDRRRIAGLVPQGGTLAVATAFIVLVTLPWSAGDAMLAMPDVEFPEPIAKLRWLWRVLVGGVLLVGFGLLTGARTRLERLSPSWQGRCAAIAVAAGGLILLWVAHCGLARVHVHTVASLFGVGALVCVAIALRALGWPRRVVESKATLLGLALITLLGVYVPGAARDQARFALWGHSAMARLAEAVRQLLDRDGDAVLPAWLGGAGDCVSANGRISPLEVERPGDGVDQDCRGGDAPAQAPPAPVEPLSECARSEQPRDVLVIAIDALRAAALDPEIMPALSELARGSLVFERAYSPTVMTFTSVSAIFSGRPFADVGPQNALIDENISPRVTLAEQFRAAGYRTAAFSDVFDHPVFRRGFDHVNDYWHDPEVAGPKGQLTSASKMQGILELLQRDKRPAFVWAHVLDVHAPYPLRRGPEGERLTGAAAYYRGAAYVDQQLATLFLALRGGGRLERTILAITADHGEELQERGRVGHGPNVFEESVHVPLVIWAPGCRPRRVAEPVSLAHLAASLGQLANVEMPGVGLLGRRDLPIVVEAVTALNTTYKRAVIHGRYKLMLDVTNGGRLLFDLEADPAELTSIAGQRSDLVADLERRYQRWLDAPGRR